MSKEKKEQFMRFGQIIRIHGHRLADSKSDRRGMIVAKGFTDPDAKYMTFKTFQFCEFYRQALFQVLPKGVFQTPGTNLSDDEKKKLEENYQILIKQRMGDVIKFGEDVVFKHVDSQQYLSGSVSCSEGGLGAFKVELTKKLQKDLVFKMYPFRSFQKQGDKIKLQSPLRIKNMENRCYISTQKNPPEQQQDEEGEKGNGESKIDNKKDKKKKRTKKKSRKNIDQDDGQEDQKYNIVTTYSQSYTWLFHLHQGHDTLEDTNPIRTHDIILLTYTKNDGYLCLEKTKVKKQPNRDPEQSTEAMVKLPKENTGYPCYTCLWEIQKQPIPDISPWPDKKKGTDGTYTLRDLLTGQYLEVLPIIKRVKYKEKDIVGHAIDKKQDSEEITIKSAKGMTNPADFVKHNGLVKIGGPKYGPILRPGQLDIVSEPIKVDQSAMNFRQLQPYDHYMNSFLTGEGEHGFRIQKIDDQSKQQVLFILSTYEVLDEFCYQMEDDIKTIQKQVNAKRYNFIDSILIKLIAFIKECDPTDIEADTLPNKKKQYIAKDLKICNKLFKILEQMGKKILEEIYKRRKSENQAFKTVFNRAYYLILQIIKDNPITKLYVCEDWLHIILNHAIENEEDTVHQTLNQILQSNQLVVAKFLKANNKHLAARIINVFTLKPPHQKFLNIFRASCMSNGSPIVNNQKIILQEFFSKLQDDAKFIFIKPKRVQGISADLSINPDLLYLKSAISKDQNRIRTMASFFQESMRLDLSQTSNYFISYLNLLADICYGRNTEAKKYVQKILKPVIQDENELIMHEGDKGLEKYDALYTLNYILQDEELKKLKSSKNLLRSVLRLINYAFVQSADQTPILRINRYRNIDRMEDQGDEQDKFTKLKDVMEFVKGELEGFKSFYDKPITMEEIESELKQFSQLPKTEKQQKFKEALRIKRKEQEIASIQEKQLLFTELVLLKSTLIIGYWTVGQQMMLVQLLLKVLTNSKKNILHYKESVPLPQDQIKQFKLFKDEARRPTPSVELIISCKALVCELMEIIFDFNHNSLVTKCVKIYNKMGVNMSHHIGSHNVMLDDDLEVMRQKDDMGPDLYNVAEWKTKLEEIFGKQDEQKENDKDISSKMVPLMVELGIHQSPTLFFRSLLIMKRRFCEQSDILRLFLNLSIYDEESGEYLANRISGKRKDLSTLEEQSLLYTKQKGVYDKIMEFLAWLSEAIKVNSRLEDSVNFKNFKCIFDHFHEKTQINQFRQRTIKNMDLHPVLLKFIGLSRQSLQTYSDDAMSVLKYVYRFLTLLCKGFLEAKLQIYRHERVLPIIKDHIKQQVQLLKKKGIPDNSPLTAQIARRRDDCEAIQLLAELFSHNKTLLFNELQIQQTSESICDMVNTVDRNNYYKSHLLDFYRSLIYFKDKQIMINQSRILAKLQDPKKDFIYYRVLSPKDQGSENLTNYIIRLIEEFKQHNYLLMELKEPEAKMNHIQAQTRELLISPQLTYFITLFNLFANLVEGKHIVNIGKGRQVHSYEMLMKILMNGDLCYPLKTNIRNYINQLYYSTPIEEDLYNQIVKTQLPFLVEDLNIIITILVKEIPTTYILAHPIRYKFYETYFFLYIEQILFSLNYLFCEKQSQFFREELTKQLTSNYSRGIYYLHYIIIRIYERLRFLTDYYYNHNYIRGLLNVIGNIMKKDFLEQFRLKMFRIFDRDQEKRHPIKEYSATQTQEKDQMTEARQKQLKKRCTMYLHKLVKGQIKNFYIKRREEKDQNFPLTFTLPYQQKQEVPDQNQLIKKEKQMETLALRLKTLLIPEVKEKKQKVDHYLRLQTISDRLWSNVHFVNFIDRYMVDNCKKLYQIDQHSQNFYGFREVFVSFSEYIKIFVQVNSEKPESIPNNLRIFFFKVILEYIREKRTNYVLNNAEIQHSKKDMEIIKPIDRWEKDDWEKVSSQVHEAQKFLVDSSVAELIIESLKHAEDLELYASIFRFCIAYLLGGYKDSQDSIYQKLVEDEKNEVFIKIQKLIARLGKRITSRIAERTQRRVPDEDQFVVNALDQYDFFDSKIHGMKKFESMTLSDKEEQYEETLEKEVFGMVFKFMQQLCQCNHIQLKNFVREQINQNKEKKNYSFSLISVAIFQIRRLFKVMNKEASTIILPLIDFINQVVTIPCLQNQRSLCETTFFQDLCYMSSFFSEQANIKERGFDSPDSYELLNKIYKQCILIILNVLESNQQSLIRELLVKVKARFLLSLIKKNLESEEIRTQDDFVKKIDGVYAENEKVPTKIQDTMNVMIVLQKLQKSDITGKFTQQKEACIAEYSKDAQNLFQMRELIKKVRQQMLKIQIVSISSGKKQDVYFPKHPILKTLSPTTRDRIMLEVSRSTQREKIKSLLSFKDEIICEINHNFQIQKQKLLGIIPYKPQYITMLQNNLFHISFLINFIWFFCSDIFIEYHEVNYFTDITWTSVLKLLDGCQLFITLLYFASYYKCQKQLALFRAAQSKEQQAEEPQGAADESLINADGEEEKKVEKEDKEKNNKLLMLLKLPFKLVFMMISWILGIIMQTSLVILLKFDAKFPYVFAYLLTSIFGTFRSQSIFLGYILFFFMENDTLSNVFNAIVYNLGQLASVGSLGIVFVYVFCLVFYETYALEMMSDAGDEACDSILGCILDLYVSGTIGGSVDSFKIVRFATDLIYFIFFGLLFGNIISGIMINTFAALRTKRDQMYDDKKNRCYICGKDRGMLQKNNEKFDKHITEKHFLWNYIFYTYCLNSKHETDYSGLQYEIKRCLSDEGATEEDAIMWIPFNEESDEGYTQKIIQMEEMMLELTEMTKQKVKGLQSATKGEQDTGANEEGQEEIE